ERRFQTARDLSFALGTLSGGATTAELEASRMRLPLGRIALGILADCALGASIWFAAAKFHGRLQNPQYQRVTFQRGTVFAARFAPDGRIVYEAAWNGRESKLFSTLSNPSQTHAL